MKRVYSWAGIAALWLLAVELVLQDTRGRAHRLSELLVDKPVLLWFGAIT